MSLVLRLADSSSGFRNNDHIIAALSIIWSHRLSSSNILTIAGIYSCYVHLRILCGIEHYITQQTFEQTDTKNVVSFEVSFNIRIDYEVS